MELYKIEGRHVKFNKEFYDLPLYKKYECIHTLDSSFLSDFVTMERLVLAILQHSSKKFREEYPVKAVRKLSLKAKLADEEHYHEVQYGLETGDAFD